MKKRLFSILLLLAMVITMMPAMASLSFAGEANPTVPVELVKATTSGSRAVKLSWNKVSGATKYVVYGQKCGQKCKKLITTSKTSYEVKKIKKTKLKAHKGYTFYVVAYSGSKKIVKSKSIHFITGKTSGKYANAKSITVKPTSVTLEPGKTVTLKATTKIYKNKKHIKKSHGAATRYVSNCPAVAKVSSSGKVTAVAPGTATIYVQDIGGLWCKTVVTVKKSEPPAPVLTPVDAPTAATGLNYNGTEQTGVAESTGYTVTNGKATGAGSYTATATLAEGYKWSDDTTAAKEITWSIAKAALTATADNKNVTVGDAAPSYTVTYTGWVNSESIETVTPTTVAVLTSEYTTTSPAGEYDITFTTEPVFANYSVTTVNGKLTAAVPTFKAVYNAKNDANTLTFYYDAVDHSGENITVYEGSSGDNYLFDNSKSNGKKWGYNDNRGSITSVVIDASVANYKGLTSTTFMFWDMAIATNITGAEHLDVSNVTDMSNMFKNFGGGKSSSPTTLNVVPDVSEWNTGNVTNMAGMFESYGNFSSSLDKVPDVSGWNTSNVTDMFCMFQKYGHESQTFNAVPDVSNWNTGNVTSMKNMFKEYGHKSTMLNTVPNVSKWKTGNVTNVQEMFVGYGNASQNISCELDLSGWDLSRITGANGNGVFNFKPNTFVVKIPAKTGANSNESTKWYYGDGTNHIAPPEGKTFTLPPAGALPGKFSVSATKKVYFS